MPPSDTSQPRLNASLERGLVHKRMSKTVDGETRRRKVGSDDREAAVVMVCHELRNALGPLLNAAELLNLPDTDIETWRWARQTLLRQAQHMKHLLTDMLDPRLPETGLLLLNVKILDLSQLVETICTDHQGLFEAHELRLIIYRLPAQVLVAADALRLTQVVTNLFHNAIKFTNPGGKVTVRLRADKFAGDAVLSIRDTGRGMSSDMLACMLADWSELKHLQCRHGIGLPLTRQILRQHGGELLANSAGPGQGSEFVVRLPLASTALRCGQNTASPKIETRPKGRFSAALNPSSYSI